MNINSKYGLNIKKFPTFQSSGKSLQISSIEQLIVAGGINGELNYPTFPTLSPVINEKLHLFYKHGSLHNGDADARIMYRVGTITGVTIGEPQISWSIGRVLVAPISGASLTNPSFQLGLNNRFILKYQLFYGVDGQETYVIYSDNEGTTWSSPVRMTTDYAPPNIILATGEGIKVENNLYQICHADKNNPYKGPQYISNDNGITWSTSSFVFNTDSNQFEEPTALVRNDGLVMAFLRSGQTKKISMKYSLNGSASWCDGFYQGLFSDSKPTVAQFPSGGIVIAGRNETDTTRRSTMGYSNDGGKTFTEQNADSYTTFGMYAGLSYHSTSNKIIAVIAYLRTSNLSLGPSSIYCKTIAEV